MPRTGWMAGPVRPEAGSIPEPFDPLRLGVTLFTLRWPRTARLLTTEFGLSREQAWSVAWRCRRHKSLWKGRLWLVARFLAVGLLLSPVAAVFGAMPAWEAFLAATERSAAAEQLPIWSAGLVAAIALAAAVAWVVYERYGMDRLIDASIRDRWRDQVCLWCSHDMEESVPHGDRWAICPECGMRSPVAVRTP